jgi:succinate dehydrogenase membrane anchor subunit
MAFRTPLAKARGLGSAKAGFHHWWLQRVTAVALIPLTVWFGFGIAVLPGAGYSDVVAWIGAPLNTVLLISLIIATCYHAALGLQVVVEDYVHTEWVKIATIMAMNLFFILISLAALYAALRIALVG